MHARPIAAAFAALLLAACGGAIEKPRSCLSQADCPGDSFCRRQVCVASAAPIAVVTAPAGPYSSHTKLTFTGERSGDPDPEDHVASLSWTARRVQADCDPFPASAAASGVDVPFTVVFGCAGTFEIRLVAADSTGRASAPAVVPLAVALSSVVPAIAVGSDLQIQHVCTQGPLLCTTGDSPSARTFALSAAATSPVSTSIQYQWSVELPAALSAAPPRVIFTPSAAADAPTVRIETDGTGIAGDYLFSVVATDEWHLSVVGHQRVTVGNRPPAVAGGGTVQVAHRYDAAASPPAFRAGGVVAPVSVSDPDGDPLEESFTGLLREAPGTTFDVLPGRGSASYDIAVPYRTPADALLLLGAPGLSRTITYLARDPNGAEASVTWSVEVMNRAPRVVTEVPAAVVDHGFDVGTSRYVASAPASEYVDDDGDPIAPRAPTGDAVCDSVSSLLGGGRPTVACSLVFTGPPAVHLFQGVHRLQIAMGDPWSSLPAQPFALTILNRPPVATTIPALRAASCSTSPTCCDFDPILKVCNQRYLDVGPAEITIPPPAADPDGDPLAITFGPGCTSAAPAAFTCPLASCPNVTVAFCGDPGACGLPATSSLSMTASDGAASVSFSNPVETLCP